MPNKAHLQALEAKEQQRKLSKEELLRPRLIKETVFVEGLQGEITIKSVSHAKRQELHKLAGVGTDDFDGDRLTMLTIAASIVEPELSESDVAALREQDAAVIDEISMHISALNLMGRSGELKKESSETQN